MIQGLIKHYDSQYEEKLELGLLENNIITEDELKINNFILLSSQGGRKLNF
jgi:hypothetical protein